MSADDLQQAAFTAAQAAKYLGFQDARWMDTAPIARCDVRKPGASRPVWRWRRVDLDAFLERRLVQPGHLSPWGEG